MAVEAAVPDATLLAAYAPLRPVDTVPRIVAHQAPDVFALWQAWEAASGTQQNTPFWATVWPASRVLAKLLLDQVIGVRGQRVLDLGCGGGVAAIAALMTAAGEVVANDIDAVALEITRRNAVANGVTPVCNGDDLVGEGASERYDVVLVADMFYEADVSRRMMDFLRVQVSRGARVYVADAGRPFAPEKCGECLCEQRVLVDGDLEGKGSRLVRVMQLAY